MQRAIWVVVALAVLDSAAALFLDPMAFLGGFGWRGLRLVLAAMLLPILVWALYQPVGLAIARHPAPLRELPAIAARNAPRLWMVFLVMALFLLNANSVAVIKVSIPRLIPFYADGMFAQLDRMIFGTDPWRITHRLGDGFTFFCDRLYVSWFAGLYGAIAVLAFSTDRKKQFVGLFAFSLIWIVLGQLGATLLSSAGPILVGDLLGDRQFDPLLAELRRTPELFALMARDRLIGMHFGIGAGISAMPSMHVAMAIFWMMLTRMYAPRLWPLAAAYAAAIWIASVHLGWHYAVDGFVSLLGVLFLWRVAERVADTFFGEADSVQNETRAGELRPAAGAVDQANAATTAPEAMAIP